VRGDLGAFGLLAQVLLLFLGGATWAFYLQAKGGKPAWPLGAAMRGLHLPVSLAEGACRLSKSKLRAFDERIKGRL